MMWRKNLPKFLALLVLGLLSWSNLLVQADLSISPYNQDLKNPANKGWLVYALNPGESTDDLVKVVNDTDEDKIAHFLPRDYQPLEEAKFSLIADSATNKNAGNWININEATFDIPAKTASLPIPFSVKVPDNTESGEYAAGITMTEIKGANPNQNFFIQTRSGLRSYIAVKGNLKLGEDVSNLHIINPQDNDFDKESQLKGYIGKDNMVLRYSAINQGNIFGLLEGKYTISYADGSIKTGEFSQELPPRISAQDYYISTNLPFQQGQTKVELDYQLKPLNSHNPEVEINQGNTKGHLSASLRLSQTELDNFQTAKFPLQHSNVESNSSSISQTSSISKTESADNNAYWRIYLVAIMLLIFGYFYLRYESPIFIISFEQKVWQFSKKVYRKIFRKKPPTSSKDLIDKDLFF